MFVHQLLAVATKIIFPPLCVHCRREGGWLCTEANQTLNSLPVLIDPLQIDGVDRVICRGDYNEPVLAALIQRIKYDFWTGASETLLDLLAPVVPHLVEPTAQPIIIPVPLHWRRKLWRGFNQSVLLAQAISNVTHSDLVSIVERHQATTPQAKLKGHDRVANVAGAFRLHINQSLPAEVILVDDVITTGSTIKECAAVLLSAGVQKITAVALAKG